MARRKFNLIVAASENLGIGKEGKLPWRLKNELQYFNQQTTKTKDEQKRNAIIMGRLTYYGIPESKRPLPKRLNIVLSSTLNPNELPSDVVICKSLSEAVTKLSDTELGTDIENIWIGGGNSVYREAMASDDCHRVYFTEIKMHCDCDAFFPEIPNDFEQVPNNDDIPNEIQEENGIKYQYKIFEKK